MSRSRLSHELPTRNSPLSRSRSRRGSEWLRSIHNLRLLAARLMDGGYAEMGGR